MPRFGRLKVHGRGNTEVEETAKYLADLNHAYNSLVAFESIIDGMRRFSRAFPAQIYPFGFGGIWPSRGARRVVGWPATAEEIASFVPARERLILQSVSLTSPGFWEFVGTINPLEVIRKSLNDRHERRKDHEYREHSERKRLELENALLENEVLSGRVKIAKELGATDRDLAPLLNELVYRPLRALGRNQDNAVIEEADPVLPTDDHEP
jgi:hypothetical protein